MHGLNVNYEIIEMEVEEDDDEFDEKDILRLGELQRQAQETWQVELPENEDIVPLRVYHRLVLELSNVEDIDSIKDELFEHYLFGSKNDQHFWNVVMIEALRWQKLKVVNLLLKMGMKIVPLDDSGRTIVHVAYFDTEMPENAGLLLNYCDEVNYRDAQAVTHLHIACAVGNIDAVRRYIKQDYNVNLCCHGDFWRPVHAAASRFNKDILELLVQNGADPFSALIDGQTPWNIVLRTRACSSERKSKLDTIKFLVDCGKQRKDFDPIYDICLECRESTDFLREAIAKCMRREFADFVRLDKNGQTILHALAERVEENERQVAVAKMLLDDFPLDVDVKNRAGQMPLDVAVYNLNVDMASLLIFYGADLGFITLYWKEFNFPKIEKSPLLVYQDIWDIMRVLVLAGFDMDWEKFLQIYSIIRTLIERVCIDQQKSITKTLQYGNIELFQNAYDKLYQESSDKDEHQIRRQLLFDLQEYRNIVRLGKMNMASDIPKNDLFAKVVTLSRELGVNNVNMDLEPYKLEINKMARMRINDMGVTLLDICQIDSLKTFKLLQGRTNIDLLFSKADSLPLTGELVKSYVFKAYVRGYCTSIGTNLMVRCRETANVPKKISEQILNYMSNDQIMYWTHIICRKDEKWNTSLSEIWKRLQSETKTVPLANALHRLMLSGKLPSYFECCSIL